MAKKATAKQIAFIEKLMSTRDQEWLDHFADFHTSSRTRVPEEFTSYEASAVINSLLEEAPESEEIRKAKEEAWNAKIQAQEEALKEKAQKKTTPSKKRVVRQSKASKKQVDFIMKLQDKGAWRTSNFVPQPLTRAEAEALTSFDASHIIDDLLAAN